MSLEHMAISKTDDFPIAHIGKVHSGKVRSVYRLSSADSKRIIHQKGYDIPLDSRLGVMIDSDRISAFDCNWKGQEGLMGVPQKGVALNAVSSYWFGLFDTMGIVDNHVLDVPHPLVWIVRIADMIKIEGIARRCITGSMWRAYEKGERDICGITLPDGLKRDQQLPDTIMTPSTKGIMRGIPEVPQEDDVNITRKQIIENYSAFGLRTPEDWDTCVAITKRIADATAEDLEAKGYILADFKLEFGYVSGGSGKHEIILCDEPPTPDSSRMWDRQAYTQEGKTIEASKEGFRKYLLRTFDPDLMLNKKRMKERRIVAESYRVPLDMITDISDTYSRIAQKIIGHKLPDVDSPREEIIESLMPYGIVRK